MLEVKNASASFGGHRLFEKLSFIAADSSLFCIVGNNKEAKATLIDVVMGLYPLDEGHVSIDGELLSAASAQEFRRQLISYVPSLGVTNEGSVGELSRTLFALEANKTKPLPQTLLEEEWKSLGLSPEIYGRSLSQLTVGESRRVLLGMVCIQNKPIILADEPLAGLDAETAQLVAAYLVGRANHGQTVVATCSNGDLLCEQSNNRIELI